MKRIAALLLALATLVSLPAAAADLLVAQAANFAPAMKEIIPAFEKASGLTVQATYASTGKLYGQIINGAPFDVFLAADRRRPERLHADGLATEAFVYAEGSVVLWSRHRNLLSSDWKTTLQNPDVKKIAIANTETAPYGASAMKAIQTAGLWKTLQPRLVFGQSISQVFQFSASGAADAGLCAYASVFTEAGRKGCFMTIPEAPPVVQAACVLTSTPHGDAAARFVKFLSSSEAKAIKLKYGYR